MRCIEGNDIEICNFHKLLNMLYLGYCTGILFLLWEVSTVN